MLLESGEDVDLKDQVLVLSSFCKLNVQLDLLPSLRSWILEFLSCPGCDRLTFSEGFRAISFEPMKRGTTRAVMLFELIGHYTVDRPFRNQCQLSEYRF